MKGALVAERGDGVVASKQQTGVRARAADLLFGHRSSQNFADVVACRTSSSGVHAIWILREVKLFSKSLIEFLRPVQRVDHYLSWTLRQTRSQFV